MSYQRSLLSHRNHKVWVLAKTGRLAVLNDIAKEYGDNKSTALETEYAQWFYANGFTAEGYEGLEKISAGLGLEVINAVLTEMPENFNTDLLNLLVKYKISAQSLVRVKYDWSNIDLLASIKETGYDDLILDNLRSVIDTNDDAMDVIVDLFSEKLRNPEKIAEILLDDPDTSSNGKIINFIEAIFNEHDNEKKKVMLVMLDHCKRILEHQVEMMKKGSQCHYDMFSYEWSRIQKAKGILKPSGDFTEEIDSAFIPSLQEVYLDSSVDILDLITVFLRITNQEKIGELIAHSIFMERVQAFLRSPILNFNSIAQDEVEAEIDNKDICARFEQDDTCCSFINFDELTSAIEEESKSGLSNWLIETVEIFRNKFNIA